jgi:hypothetical protein
MAKGALLEWRDDSEGRVHGTKSEFDPARIDYPKETHSMVPLSLVGGLLLVGYGISRIRAKRGAKPGVQTLFGTK